MKFVQYDTVCLKRIARTTQAGNEQFDVRPPRIGDIACIVEIYSNPPGYELECSDEHGITQWLTAFGQDEVELECLERNVVIGCHFRYFFDPGSGTCLWSANDKARARFGDAVDLRDLDLPPEVAVRADALLAHFDTSIDWDHPAGPSPWPETERTRFAHDAAVLLEDLRQCMDSHVTISDETERGNDAKAVEPYLATPWQQHGKSILYDVIAWSPIIALACLLLFPDAWSCVPINPAGKEMACGYDYAHPFARFARDILIIAGGVGFLMALILAWQRRLSRFGLAGFVISLLLQVLLGWIVRHVGSGDSP